MTATATTAAYLRALPPQHRKALMQLRAHILSAAPGATAHFGYGMPGFKYNGHPLVYTGAAKDHVALYGAVPAGLQHRLKGFTVTKGSIQFKPNKPLPAAMLKAIVKAKVAEIDARWPGRGKAAKKQDLGSNGPEQPPVLSFETAQAWHAWLKKNGSASNGVFLQLGKKNSGLRSVTAPEALEVALCHGWIDAIRKPKDERTFLQRYVPRGPRSIWSQMNKKKVEELIAAGLMLPAGLAAVEQAKKNGQWELAYAPASTMAVPSDLQAELDRNQKAAAFFATLKSNNRYAVLHRLHTAKKPETRAKRLQQFIGMLERGETFH